MAAAEVEKVLVTGSSGYLATHIVQQLLEAGYTVRGTVRSLKNEQKVKPLRELCPGAAVPLELVEADLTDANCWERAVEGCSHVLHTASPVPAKDPSDPNEIYKPAIDGTLNILRACAKHRVKRVVVTSSMAAVSGGVGDKKRPDHVFTEEDWTDLRRTDINTYVKSKTMAEKAAWDFVKDLPEEKFELATINPGYIVGPMISGSGDAASAEFPRRLLQHEMPMLPKLFMFTCDVREVAAAHIKAMILPDAAGHRHLIVANEGLWVKDIAAILNEEFRSQGYKVPLKEAPNMLISFFGIFDKGVRMLKPWLGMKSKLDNSRMRNVLGLEPIDPKISLVDMAYSMIERGWIKKTPQYVPRESSD